MKRFFTGNLEADVISNPFFFGKEKELLRAQIARISHATSIEPKGYHKKAEDNERELADVTEEEKKVPTFEQLAKLETWCHLSPGILKV